MMFPCIIIFLLSPTPLGSISSEPVVRWGRFGVLYVECGGGKLRVVCPDLDIDGVSRVLICVRDPEIAYLLVPAVCYFKKPYKAGDNKGLI
jgi:hypothetical protein